MELVPETFCLGLELQRPKTDIIWLSSV